MKTLEVKEMEKIQGGDTADLRRKRQNKKIKTD